MSDDKKAILEAIAEYDKEKTAAMKKEAQDRSDAVELGVRAFIKKAKDELGDNWDEGDDDLILDAAAAIDAQG